MTSKIRISAVVFVLVVSFATLVAFAQDGKPPREPNAACGSSWTRLWDGDIIVSSAQLTPSSLIYPVDMVTNGADAANIALQQGCQLQLALSSIGPSTHTFQCVSALAFADKQFWCRSAGFLTSTIEDWVGDLNSSYKFMFNPTFGLYFDETSQTNYYLSISSFTGAGKASAPFYAFPMPPSIKGFNKPGRPVPNAKLTIYAKL